MNAMIVYDRGQRGPSKIGIFPDLDSMYNMIKRDTREHMERVGKYSVFFFQVLQQVEPERIQKEFSEAFVPICEEVFRLHDIGRVYVPLTILNKVEKLTEEEKQIIKNHTIYARNAVDAVFDFPYGGWVKELFLDIALYHHEYYDGTGYPEGRSGEEIPFGARICALADVFDGITSWKPYKTKQTSREKAGEIILSEAGRQFDPKLAELFVKTIPYLPQ